MENESLLRNRLTELAGRAERRGQWVFSEFLTLAEQDLLLRLRLDCPFTLWGGLETSERKVAAFGSEELCGYDQPPPVACLRVEPVQQKFADALAHRDILGALMSLGLRREVLGDIELVDNVAYVFCLDTVAGFIAENLTSVRHTTVRCAPSEPPERLSAPPEPVELVVASERLDAAVAAVYRLSRARARELVEAEQVYIGGRLISSASAELPEGAVVSVRHYGRFVYEGIERETRKGRLRIRVRIYGRP